MKGLMQIPGVIALAVLLCVVVAQAQQGHALPAIGSGKPDSGATRASDD
jgi:hypothetical protein